MNCLHFDNFLIEHQQFRIIFHFFGFKEKNFMTFCHSMAKKKRDEEINYDVKTMINLMRLMIFGCQRSLASSSSSSASSEIVITMFAQNAIISQQIKNIVSPLRKREKKNHQKNIVSLFLE